MELSFDVYCRYSADFMSFICESLKLSSTLELLVIVGAS